MAANGKTAEAVTGTIMRKGETVAALQAGVEGVPVNVETVYFMGPSEAEPDRIGRHFRIADRVGLMPLLKFAHAAGSGATEDSMEGMAAMYAMIKDCIHPDDFGAFERFAIDARAEGEDLMAVVEQTMEAVSARPTAQPSGSSPPDAKSLRKSKGNSRRLGLVPEQAQGLVPVAELLLSTN